MQAWSAFKDVEIQNFPGTVERKECKTFCKKNIRNNKPEKRKTISLFLQVLEPCNQRTGFVYE